MAAPWIDGFIDCLARLEESREVGPMVKSFSGDCELSNVSVTPLHGIEGAERFWRDYLTTFQEIHTRFTQVVECGRTAYLEWISEGRLASGKPLSYEGITMIQTDGKSIVRFKAYHDSAVFLGSGGKHAERITGLKGGSPHRQAGYGG